MEIVNNSKLNNNIKEKIILHKQKLCNDKNFSIFFITLIEEEIKEKIKSKNYKIKHGFIILEFNILDDNIKIKFNKFNNKISIYINDKNILNTGMKKEIVNIIKKYSIDII